VKGILATDRKAHTAELLDRELATGTLNQVSRPEAFCWMFIAIFSRRLQQVTIVHSFKDIGLDTGLAAVWLRSQI